MYIVETSFVNIVEIEKEALISIDRFSNFLRLLRVTARVLSVGRANGGNSRHLSNILKNPDAAAIEHAQIWWIGEAQKCLITDFNQGKFNRLGAIQCDGGIIVVGVRIRKENMLSYDNLPLFLLPYHHRLSTLYVEFIHARNHTGTTSTMAKVRAVMWILNLRKLAKKVVSACVTCRRLRAKKVEQLMGQLPVQRLLPAPAWQTTFVDFFWSVCYSRRGE